MLAPVPVKQRRVFVVIRPLPDELRPVYVVRHLNTTTLFVDPATTRVEVTVWLLENSTVEERNVIRAAYGNPPVGTPLPPEALEGLCWPVPACLLPPTMPEPVVVDLRIEAYFRDLVDIYQRGATA